MCNRPIRELEVQFEKIHFTPDPAQHISRCPPALAAPRPCHPPRCQQPPSAAARSPLHSRQGCTWTVIVSILSGLLPFSSPVPSAPPSPTPCQPSPSPCQPAPGPSPTFILFHSRIWNKLANCTSTCKGKHDQRLFSVLLLHNTEMCRTIKVAAMTLAQLVSVALTASVKATDSKSVSSFNHFLLKCISESISSFSSQCYIKNFLKLLKLGLDFFGPSLPLA